MPPSTRLSTPGPSNVTQSLKHAMSDAESAPQGSKKARRNSSAEPSTRRDSNRDAKRRRKRKKKAPIVSAGAAKEVTQSRQDEHSRAPLSARNEIIRFTSAPSEADLPASLVPPAEHSSQAPSSKSLGKSREGSSQTLDNIQSETMLVTLRTKKHAVPADALPEPSPSPPNDRVAQLEVELKCKDALIASHQALLNQIQQAAICQVCLDLMYKPYALAPCGHLACHSCLVNWFTAPPPDNRQAPPTIMRRKTCPHCRAVVRQRPIEVWGVKSIAQALGNSGLLANQLPVPVEASESATTDPWKDIFPEPDTPGRREIGWFFSDVGTDDDDVYGGDVDPPRDDVGMLDMEDGGIYRCLDCMHEIWDGICSNCGRVYPGHRAEGDEQDDNENRVGWLDDQMGAEEVDVADDPGWMGLENGEADDGGEMDEWRPISPWRRRFHMFRGPWGFLGTIHVDEEDEDEEEYGPVDDLRVSDQDEESGEEAYESSFIDDDDEGVERPRIYEVGHDAEDEDYDYRPTVEVVPDDPESDEHEVFDVLGHGRVGRMRVPVSSDEEADEPGDDLVPAIEQRLHSIRQRRGRVESDGSDAEAHWSDGY